MGLYKLGEVVNNYDSIRVPLSSQEREKRKGSYRYYGAQEIIDYIDGYLFDGEYILVAEDGNNLISAQKPLCTLVNGKFWVNNHAHIIQSNELSDTKYVYYLLNKINIKPYVTGSAQPKLNQANLNRVKVNLPSIDEQKEIVSKISPFDEKIQFNQKTINQLGSYSQLIFHKWFVDFNFPDENGNPYKDSGGEMIEVYGKMIPKGWSIKKLSDLVDKNTSSLTPNETPEKLFKYYSIPVFDKTRLYSEEYGADIGSNKYIVNSSMLLVSKLNPWFKRVVYPYNVDEAICSTEFVVWQPKIEELLEYLFVLSNTSRFTKYNTRASAGTSNSHKRVNPDYMLKYDIKYDEGVVREFNSLVKPMVVKIASLINENKLLEESRDLLIKKLIK